MILQETRQLKLHAVIPGPANPPLRATNSRMFCRMLRMYLKYLYLGSHLKLITIIIVQEAAQRSPNQISHLSPSMYRHQQRSHPLMMDHLRSHQEDLSDVSACHGPLRVDQQSLSYLVPRLPQSEQILGHAQPNRTLAVHLYIVECTSLNLTYHACATPLQSGPRHVDWLLAMSRSTSVCGGVSLSGFHLQISSILVTVEK
jgi:hypothetical protein